jgi:hypothetical protein
MNGQPPSSTIWWRWSANVFRWLLRLYPQPFRDAYSSQMLHDFRDLWEEAAQQRGALGISHLCWDTLGDLVVSAVAERLRKEQAMERRLVVRIGVALIWAVAVFEAFSILSDRSPLPGIIVGLLYWTHLLFDVMVLVGLVWLQFTYRQRMPWYIGLIGTVAALAFFYQQLLPKLLSLGLRLVSGKGNAPDFAFLNWASLCFSVLVLVGVVGLQVKYHLRMPWYSWLIGSVAALAFCCWEVLYLLLSLGFLPAVGIGNKALDTILIGALQNFPVFALSLIYSLGMLVWGVSTLLKGVLPRWIAMLLILFGVDSLLQWPFGDLPVANHTLSDSVFEAISQALRTFPVLGYGTTHALYALVRCLLLAGLGYALWVHNRPGSAPSEPNAAGPASPSLPEGVDPAV